MCRTSPSGLAPCSKSNDTALRTISPWSVTSYGNGTNCGHPSSLTTCEHSSLSAVSPLAELMFGSHPDSTRSSMILGKSEGTNPFKSCGMRILDEQAMCSTLHFDLLVTCVA